MRLAMMTTALSAVLLMGASAVQETTLTGMVIDNLSIEQGGILKMDDPEAAIAQLTPADIANEQSYQSGYALVRGKRAIKFDKASNKMVLDYLRSDGATLSVRVTGTQGPNGFVLKEIRPAAQR
ncbi:MAG: hypothetical protein ACK4PI_01830 [Tepidisphaerales bacterium]